MQSQVVIDNTAILYPPIRKGISSRNKVPARRRNSFNVSMEPLQTKRLGFLNPLNHAARPRTEQKSTLTNCHP